MTADAIPNSDGLSERSPIGVGIVGCGNIFASYLLGLGKLRSVQVIGCADIDQDRADSAAKLYGLRAYPSVAALLADDSIELVVNITPPLVHARVSADALARGKHVYVEKPIAASLPEARPAIEALAAGEARLGCAPDTFLAAPGQTARAALDSGLVGEPIAVSAAIPHSRAEEWHPDPTFLFKPGGGPLLDMGPYYVVNMINCLGAIRTVSGAARIGANPRLVTAPGRLVDSVAAAVPTHAVAVLTFASGVIGTLTASFDLWSDHLPHLEIYGTRGILRLPDPDKFDGDVVVKMNSAETWEVVPPTIRLDGWLAGDGRIRGLGVADLVDSLSGRPQRANAEVGYHVLEVLESIGLSGTSETVVQLTSKPARPEPVSPGDLDGKAVSAESAVTRSVRRTGGSGPGE
jgi:predicted dehydrogenase